MILYYRRQGYTHNALNFIQPLFHDFDQNSITLQSRLSFYCWMLTSHNLTMTWGMVWAKSPGSLWACYEAGLVWRCRRRELRGLKTSWCREGERGGRPPHWSESSPGLAGSSCGVWPARSLWWWGERGGGGEQHWPQSDPAPGLLQGWRPGTEAGRYYRENPGRDTAVCSPGTKTEISLISPHLFSLSLPRSCTEDHRTKPAGGHVGGANSPGREQWCSAASWGRRNRGRWETDTWTPATGRRPAGGSQCRGAESLALHNTPYHHPVLPGGIRWAHSRVSLSCLVYQSFRSERTVSIISSYKHQHHRFCFHSRHWEISWSSSRVLIGQSTMMKYRIQYNSSCSLTKSCLVWSWIFLFECIACTAQEKLFSTVNAKYESFTILRKGTS